MSRYQIVKQCQYVQAYGYTQVWFQLCTLPVWLYQGNWALFAEFWFSCWQQPWPWPVIDRKFIKSELLSSFMPIQICTRWTNAKDKLEDAIDCSTSGSPLNGQEKCVSDTLFSNMHGYVHICNKHVIVNYLFLPAVK